MSATGLACRTRRCHHCSSLRACGHSDVLNIPVHACCFDRASRKFDMSPSSKLCISRFRSIPVTTSTTCYLSLPLYLNGTGTLVLVRHHPGASTGTDVSSGPLMNYPFSASHSSKCNWNQTWHNAHVPWFGGGAAPPKTTLKTRCSAIFPRYVNSFITVDWILQSKSELGLHCYT